MDVERAENAANQERLKGSKVYYGDTIQLQNVLTEKYVCVSSKENSITESTKLKVNIIMYIYIVLYHTHG